MDRRRYLRGLAAGLAGAAGCLAAPGGGTAPTDPGGRSGVDLPVPESALFRALERDSIPAIVDPEFGEDWEGLSITVASEPLRESIEPRLSAGTPVIGVERGGRARAYPLPLLAWHEVVNDDFGGPLLVTYCPLCASGVVAERRVAGSEATFGVSGFLWRGNLVMYDRATGSLWSQLLGRAIRGERTGERLGLLPSRLTTLGEWRDAHPGTRVLLPPPRSNTLRGPDATFNYTLDPYLSYATSSAVGAGNTDFGDTRLHPKEPVIGVAAGGAAMAYPLSAVERRRVVNDVVGGLPVVVAVTPDRSLVAYERRLGDDTFAFLPAGEGLMHGGRSRWRVATGEAVDGPYEGRELSPATDRSSMFWFAWSKLHPDTGVYRR